MAISEQLSLAETERIIQALTDRVIKFKSVWGVQRFLKKLWGEIDELDSSDKKKIEATADDCIAVKDDEEPFFSKLEILPKIDDTPTFEAATREEEEEIDFGLDIDEFPVVNEIDSPKSTEWADDDLKFPLEVDESLREALKWDELENEPYFDLKSEVYRGKEYFAVGTLISPKKDKDWLFELSALFIRLIIGKNLCAVGALVPQTDL